MVLETARGNDQPGGPPPSPRVGLGAGVGVGAGLRRRVRGRVRAGVEEQAGPCYPISMPPNGKAFRKCYDT